VRLEQRFRTAYEITDTLPFHLKRRKALPAGRCAHCPRTARGPLDHSPHPHEHSSAKAF
jgi:hypothetical protein